MHRLRRSGIFVTSFVKDNYEYPDSCSEGDNAKKVGSPFKGGNLTCIHERYSAFRFLRDYPGYTDRCPARVLPTVLSPSTYSSRRQITEWLRRLPCKSLARLQINSGLWIKEFCLSICPSVRPSVCLPVIPISLSLVNFCLFSSLGRTSRELLSYPLCLFTCTKTLTSP